MWCIYKALKDIIYVKINIFVWFLKTQMTWLLTIMDFQSTDTLKQTYCCKVMEKLKDCRTESTNIYMCELPTTKVAKKNSKDKKTSQLSFLLLI